MRLAESFISSVQRLTRNEAGGAWEFMGKLMQPGGHVGLSMEGVHPARDKNVWASRISGDLRAILHRDGDELTLLYAGHHDDAYDWARRRRVERHAITGALQIVELPEVVEAEMPRPTPGRQGLLNEH